MKRTILLTVGCLLTFFSLQAQFSLDLLAGGNSNSFHIPTDEPKVKHRLGYFFALKPNYQINDQFNIGIETQYTKKGADALTSSGELLTSFSFDYIDFITEVEYELVDNVSIGLGMYYGISVQQQMKFRGQDWEEFDRETLLDTDFGANGKIKLKWKEWIAFARYSHGLKDIDDFVFTDVEGNEVDYQLYNRNFQVGIGYSFSFKK